MKNVYKNRALTLMTFLVGVIALTGCGSNSSSTKLSDVFLGGTGFRLVDSSPRPRSEYVPITSQLTLQLSEPIDPASIAGSVKVTQTQNNQITDVTVNFIVSVVSVQAVNDSVSLTPQAPMSPNATYTITMTPTLRSVSGRSFLSGAPLQFSTGAFDNIGGGVSIPGPPQAINWNMIGGGACLGFVVTFNEDLADAPYATSQAKDFLGINIDSGGSVPMVVSSYYQGNMRSFIIDYPSGYCNPDYYASGVKIKVSLSNVFDQSGEQAGPLDHTFSSGLWGF